ncbi:MAG TPA: MG2 domain-containing protein [Aquabacterium sp.]|uniref:alpha-2-macroglobulin family protein n=1 Tax=Aquabacterium sp. TaxID=1872578 RepID=UPI002E2FEC19|nr:MG2 domain-containing protein [Aquabacterium sp.]HEX5372524.1 MG2 domain-containing protein [Aquabacterium sp.]
MNKRVAPWRALVWAGLCLMAASGASAAGVRAISPQGAVGQARQVVVQFDQAVVPLGDPRQDDPYSVNCQGEVPRGQGRWLNDRVWAYDFESDLSPGVRCTIRPRAGWAPRLTAAGALTRAPQATFQTGGPAVVRLWPEEGEIEEQQHWLLQLSGPALLDTVTRQAYCQVEGVGERLPVRVVTGAERKAVIQAQGVRAPDANLLLLTCQRPLPAGRSASLVWGEGIAAQALPTLLTEQAQRFDFEVRRAFLVEFSCERERAQGPCLPIRPLTVNFSSPVPRALAEQVRIVPAQGPELKPQFDKDDRREEVDALSFKPPLPDNAALRVVLPRQLKDASGRSPANAGTFPLAVRTGGTPPLAKFATAPFGVIELQAEPGQPPVLPLTVRHVERDLRVQGVRTGQAEALAARTKVLQGDADILNWMARVRRHHETSFSAEELGRPRAEWHEWRVETDERGKTHRYEVERRIGSRELSLLKDDKAARRLSVPAPDKDDPRPFEVIGLPLQGPGYHVVEIESPRLGAALLARPAPMYVRTGVLVTNLGVHIKHGRDSSAVWVTSLDKARPVAAVDLRVHDCHGTLLWQGRTDAQGLARIDQPLDAGGYDCPVDHGLFVTARQRIAQGPYKGQQDVAFAFSSWQKGVEPWRFHVPTDSPRYDGDLTGVRLHTVTDRALLRAGETVSMKHFMRLETRQGLAPLPKDRWPSQLKLVHQGSGDEVVLPLQWRAGGSALSSWAIPREAKLGVYDIQLISQGSRGERSTTSGRFRVEEFRLPLIQARLSGPGAAQIAPTELPLQAQLSFLSGGAMAQAPGRVSAVLRERWLQFAPYPEFNFQPSRQTRAQPAMEGDEGEGAEDSGDRLLADRLPLITDKDGAARVLIPRLPPTRRAMSVRAELSFNDPNGEVQTVGTEVPLWPAEVVVGLKAGSWASNRGTVKFQALVLDTQGKPRAGQKVKVQARLSQEISARKRIVGGLYSYDNRTEVKDLGQVCSGQTDARGLLLCEAEIDQAGEVELIAQAADAKGRVSEAATTVWITRQGELWFSQDDDDRMDVLPEKKSYEPGEVARLQVRMPFREATVLVSVEREGIIDTRVMTLEGEDPTIELPIPTTRSWAPNVFVSVMAVRGRVHEVPWYSFFTWGWRTPLQWWKAFRGEGRDFQMPTAMVDLSKPAFKLGVAQLQIGRAQHELRVEVIPDKARYGIRQTVRAKVRVTHQGRPVSGEIAFAAVDEALLSLADNDSWQLLDAMLRERAWAVETGTAQNEIVGRRHYGRKAVAPGGGGGHSASRELFETLLLWQGAVTLDARGEALIQVPLNDSLTSFRLVAVAQGLPSRQGIDTFGTGHASIQVTQDLQMLSGLPPLVREGDQFQAIFTLRNTTAQPMTVQADLKGLGRGEGLPDQALTLPPQRVQVPAGGAREIRWSVTVPAQITALQWQASALQVGATAGVQGVDRLTLSQRVQSAVPVRVWAATLRQVEGTVTVPVAAPAGALTQASAEGVRPRGGVQVGLQPRLTGALPGIRRYFETYPFVCLEQKTSKAVGLKDAAMWEQVARALPSYLDSDGLASYFPPSGGSAPQGSDRLTAYVLAATHEAGFELPGAARDTMLAGLSDFVQGRVMRDSWSPPGRPQTLDLTVRKLAAIEALSRYGRADARMLEPLILAPQTWPTAAVIDWFNILQRLNTVPQRDARLQEAEQVLRARLTYAGTTLKFSTEADDFWWWLMDNADANAAKLILAVMDRPAWKDELPRLVVGSLGRQRQGAWMTTTANLWGSLALDRFSQRFESTPVAGVTQSSLATSALRHAWSGAPQGSVGLMPWPARPVGTTLPLQVQQQGSGKPWLTVQTLAAVPLKAPLSAGYRVQRELKVLDGNALKDLPAGALPRGTVLRVRLSIDAQSDMTWVALSDPIPAGATVLGSGLGRDSQLATSGERSEGFWPVYIERSFEAWRGYFAWLPKGRHVVEYTVRLNNPGRFQLPPTRIEAMYAPETFGELPNQPVEVQP